MRLIEIRDSQGLLVIGPASIFPPLLRNADNVLLRDRALNALTDKSGGMEQLRRQWGKVFPGEDAQHYSDAQLREHLRRGLGSRHIQAVHLSDNLRGMKPAVVQRADDHTLVHLEFPGKTVLIAPRGTLPPEFLTQVNAAEAARLIGSIGDGHPMGETLGRQASRVTQEGLASGKTANLSKHLARQVELGFLHAAVIDKPQAIKRAAEMPSAPRPFAALTTREKLYAAFLKCLPLVGHDIRKALDQLLKPANLALMIGFLLLFAGLQAIPGVNVVVDIGMLAWLLWTVGTKGPEGIRKVIAGAVIAGNAKSEPQLDEAARHFADGFEDLGEAGISALLAWLQGLRFASRLARAGAAEAEGGAAANAAKGPKPAGEPPKPVKAPKPAPAAPKQPPPPPPPPPPAQPLKNGVAHEADRLAKLGVEKNTEVWRPTQADMDSSAFKVIVGEPKFTAGGLPKGTIFDATTEAGHLEIKGGSSMLDSTYQLRLQTYRSVTTGKPLTIETTRPINPAFQSWLDRWGVTVVKP